MRRAILAVLGLLLLLSGSAGAATLTGVSGVLSAAQGGTGASTNIVCVAPGARTLIIDVIGTSTPAMTIQMEHSNDGTTWAVLTTTAYAAMAGVVLSTGVPSVSWSINMPPLGCYRTNVTAFTTGLAAISYRAGL